MRRIFLHAGEPKTGTSAIQLLLHENREVLERFGYLVPKAGASTVGNYGGLFESVLGEPVPPRYEGCIEAFSKELRGHGANSVIVSAERLDYCFRREEQRDQILHFLRNLGLAITVVMFIRPDAEALSSAYAEQVKLFRSDIALREFVRRQRRHIHLLKLAQLPDLQTNFRPYTAEVRRAGAGREFLRAIGVPDDALERLGPERRVNESIGPIAVAAAREIRRRIEQMGRQPTDRQRNALKAELFRLIEQAEPEPGFYGGDADVLEEIENRMAVDREKFAAVAWGKSWQAVFGPEQVLKKSNAFNAATAAPETIEKYEKMTAALWSAAQRIMSDPKLSAAAAWDRSHRDARRAFSSRQTP